jgi:hypothetical protein
LSNIANILPYYGQSYEHKIKIVLQFRPEYIPKFVAILGQGLFADPDYNYMFFSAHGDLYEHIKTKYPNLCIDFGEKGTWKKNLKDFSVVSVATGSVILDCGYDKDGGFKEARWKHINFNLTIENDNYLIDFIGTRCDPICVYINSSCIPDYSDSDEEGYCGTYLNDNISKLIQHIGYIHIDKCPDHIKDLVFSIY